MTFNEYQTAAAALAVYDREAWDVYLPLQLASEAGEVAGKFGKAIRKNVYVEDLYKREELMKEIGDVLWYVANIANELGVTLEDVAEMNIHKLRDRVERNVIHGDGDNR